jgi:uncharacterized protein (TIGR01777 family)
VKIVLAGGSGYLGSALASSFAADGHDVVILTRQPKPPAGSVRFVVWRPDRTSALGQPSQEWAHELDGADAVVNLAGAGLADRRWTAARKGVLRGSRLVGTRQLISAIRAAARRPPVFVQGSAVGYYGTAGDEILDESSPAGSDFLAHLCVDWEREGQAAEAFGCRVVIVRTGIVLSKHGGALRKLLPAFRLFAGGPIASGRQYMSWIHLDDWVAMVRWAIDTPSVSGPINATAPAPVPNMEFSTTLGRVLNRPAALQMPGRVLRILIGEMADLALIKGQRVVPARARALGFTFRYPAVDAALHAAVTGG